MPGDLLLAKMLNIWQSILLLALQTFIGILLRIPEGLRRPVLGKFQSTAYRGTIEHPETLFHGFLFERHCKVVMILEQVTISTAQ